MRLQSLNLVRFGKFTDTEISLPKAEHDFHLVIGPNEAGKSTVRGAIADLLFGFPARYQSMAFLHQQSDLRLAATVSEGTEHLAFIRTKGNKNTLRTAADTPLADDALMPFMGQADRAFFETMFGLGHEQLVKGGDAILDASKDVSQVLFQSAAGIAGLGKVRDGLLAEADKLWGSRHSSSRAYYLASDQFELANRDLKTATVRTKNWADARAELDDVEARIAAATERKGTLQASRLKLERVRRLAPMVGELKQKLAELDALGKVLELPANASETQNLGEQDLSVAETTLHQCELAVEQLTQQRDEVIFDAVVLASKDDIQRLAAFGESVRNHYAGLLAGKADVERCLELARAAAVELGWPSSEDEAALRARLPNQLTLRELLRLVNEHGGLLQSKTSTAESVEDKRAELAEAEEELKGTIVAEVSAALRSALSEAQAFRNTATAQAKLDAAVKTAQRALDAAETALGGWRRGAGALQQMSVPSPERLVGLVAKRQRLDSELSTAVNRVDQAVQDFTKAELEVKQFAEARHIVTSADVREARDKRDAEWQSIKLGSTALASGAAGVDMAIALADELVDTQLGSTTDAAELQSLKHRVERADVEHAAAVQTKERKEAELAAFDEEWQALTNSLNLPGLALVDAHAWMTKRELVLSAHAAVGEKEDSLRQEVEASQAAIADLQTQMAQVDVAVPSNSTLSTILTLAEELVSGADSAIARRTQLVKQRDSGTTALGRLQAAADAASARFEAWASQWNAAVTAAGLSDYVKSVEDTEQAIANVNAVKDNLDKAAATGRDRIDTMNRDLDEFKRLAVEVVETLGLSELRGADAREVVRVLAPKLKEAEAGEARRATAEQSLTAAIERRDAAQRQVEQVQAKVAPLLAAAGVASLADAAPLVARSEEKRKLSRETELARAALTQGSDGLGLDTVIAEVDSCDLGQVAVDLTSIEDSLDLVQTEQTRLAVEHTRAKLTLEAFGGGREAANAEARKQEALAAMADASERYIKVTAAAKLLSWAIERYREQNQGPLLTRAGAIFATLTLGRFAKLLVDFESTPPRLTALRTDGKTVEVPGLSEGTRDQLYLALRLAALEVHLAKAKALPFVADDLFINFDDERSTAGLEALRELSKQTQVLFLSHHDHLRPRIERVFGSSVNVVYLQR
ncbi:AAA family ATPase [Ralstonia nicotianae]|uniref:YhaN family protein n=1 Tax=Ralstonia pseudosolanacearum TaxID=1310165 RepID=UPI0020065C95|nr:YhaN family protein [Ralstonia pseudosolanacearum]MCK4118345.1 AAA family ATPase [Ralstonia pseudosolanacearum]